MPSCTYFKTFSVVLGLVLSITTQNAFCAADKEPAPEKITIPLSSEPEFTFTVPMEYRVNLFLLRTKNEAKSSSIGRITITDEGCTSGHQVSITYEKKPNEYLTVYFPKEIPWGTTYKLRISRDSKTLTFDLNGETISVTPYHYAKFIHFLNNPEFIRIINIEQH